MEKSPQLPPSEENHANLPQKSDSPHHPRLRSLDLLRGGSILTMLFVSSATPDGLTQLRHSPFLTNRITFADTIFPTFLFSAGLSGSISKPSLQATFRRTALLTCLGLTNNFISSFLAGRSIRIPGVLQRTALSCFVNTVQPFYTWLFPLLGIGIWYWISVGFSDPRCSLQANRAEKWFSPPDYTAQTRIDRFIFGRKHMFNAEYDPEGLLSTLTTSAVTVCAGTLTYSYLIPLHQKYCVSPTSTSGSRIKFYTSALFLSYLLIHPVPALLTAFFPISKPLWTPPFLFQTTGISLLFWLLASVIDVYPSIPGTRVLEAMGRRSLEVYLCAEILLKFAMYPRSTGGLWGMFVGELTRFGIERKWSCFVMSCCWAGVFAALGFALDLAGWKIK